MHDGDVGSGVERWFEVVGGGLVHGSEDGGAVRGTQWRVGGGSMVALVEQVRA